MKSYSIIGLMSGTSLDGVDFAYCTFTHSENRWNYKVHHVKTYPYPSSILETLSHTKEISSIELLQLDQQLGDFFGHLTNEFIEEYKIDRTKIDAVASHGHTVFHQPDRKITLQIGCGRSFSNRCGLPVINDFRKQDVLHGGQGAPLVPIGDLLLFADEADAFLNIGGFCNISVLGDPIIAFDICPGNLPLNSNANLLGHPYDSGGQVAKNAKVNHQVLSKLNELDHYRITGPKSLGTEWLEEKFNPVLEEETSAENRLATVTEHEALQISKVLNSAQVKSVFITGGGAKNNFLIERIIFHFAGNVILPDLKLIDFKEAIVFAFLGALFLDNQVNCLASVTGATENVKGGVLYAPKQV